MNHREYLTKLIGKECQYEKYGRGALLTYNKISEKQDIENNTIYDTLSITRSRDGYVNIQGDAVEIWLASRYADAGNRNSTETGRADC